MVTVNAKYVAFTRANNTGMYSVYIKKLFLKLLYVLLIVVYFYYGKQGAVNVHVNDS